MRAKVASRCNHPSPLLHRAHVDDAAPAQSALYHLARALIRSGALAADDLVDAARAIEREGSRDDPDNERWDEFAHLA